MHNQHKYLLQLEEVVERHIEEVISVYQNLPAEHLLQPSATGGWSIVNCFQHLNSYATYYHPKIKEKLLRLPPANDSTSFRNTWLGLYFVRMMKGDATKMKYKAIKRHIPEATKSPHTSVQDFMEHQEHLLQLMEMAHSKQLVKGSIPTSLSKFLKINIGDAFKFLIVHNQRHLRQAARNL